MGVVQIFIAIVNVNEFTIAAPIEKESVDEVDGLFVIPELQTKIEEQQMVKKLIPNTRKDD